MVVSRSKSIEGQKEVRKDNHPINFCNVPPEDGYVYQRKNDDREICQGVGEFSDKGYGLILVSRLTPGMSGLVFEPRRHCSGR